MMTIKEMSELTGVSARTLRYYDEIGLFVPTQKSGAGYRLYDEKALEVIQQILFFRELDIPLAKIKEIIENPALDRKNVLQMQRKMLAAEKERIERLIASIDDSLKGADIMDFTVFDREETEELFYAMFEHMPKEMRDMALLEFGSKEEWKRHYVDAVSQEKVQKQYAKIVEWYGGKEAYTDSVKNPVSKEVASSYQKRFEHILNKLSLKKNCDVNSFEVRELIGEYGFVLKQLLQLKEEKEMMLVQARLYEEEEVRKRTDEQYGEGFAEFLMRAVRNFYNEI